MRVYRARKILTMNSEQPEISDAGIAVAGGRIAAIGPFGTMRDYGPVQDFGAVTLVPGLINAHAHLGLGFLRGKISSGLGFMAWADQMFAAMRQGGDMGAIDCSIGQMRKSGTCFVADLVGRDVQRVQAALAAQSLGWCFFQEHMGLRRELAELPDGWSRAVHALYSTDVGFARSVKLWCQERLLPFSLHLAEVPGENELFQTGQGDFADFVRARRILPRTFAVPGMSAVTFAASLGLLDSHTLAVHCVHVSEADVELLAQSGATVCLCPRSNAWIGVSQAPAAQLYAAGVSICLGTDSLAANENLDLWAELRAVRGMLPGRMPLEDLLALVTLHPARALGIADEWGSLEAGKQAVWAVLPGDFGEC